MGSSSSAIPNSQTIGTLSSSATFAQGINTLVNSDLERMEKFSISPSALISSSVRKRLQIIRNLISRCVSKNYYLESSMEGKYFNDFIESANLKILSFVSDFIKLPESYTIQDFYKINEYSNFCLRRDKTESTNVSSSSLNNNSAAPIDNYRVDLKLENLFEVINLGNEFVRKENEVLAFNPDFMPSISLFKDKYLAQYNKENANHEKEKSSLNQNSTDELIQKSLISLGLKFTKSFHLDLQRDKFLYLQRKKIRNLLIEIVEGILPTSFKFSEIYR